VISPSPPRSIDQEGPAIGNSSRPSLPRLTWPEVNARRLERHYLANPARDERPAVIVAAMCGAHAQIITAAELSIGLRGAPVTRGDMQDALWTERSLVKTYGPRGTVHLLPTHELPLWTGALSAIPPVPSPFPEGARLTPEQTDEIVAAIGEVLADAELTTDELTEALVDAAGPWAGELAMPAFQTMWPRWRMATTTAAHRGALCFGPNRGRMVTYTNPRRWLPGFQIAEAHDALAGGQAGNYPVLLIDGVVAGVWHQRRSGKTIHITVEPLHDLTSAQRRDLDEQVERVGSFLGGTPRLVIGTVTVGPHA
jgi:hypothetical protein